MPYVTHVIWHKSERKVDVEQDGAVLCAEMAEEASLSLYNVSIEGVKWADQRRPGTLLDTQSIVSSVAEQKGKYLYIFRNMKCLQQSSAPL